MAIAGGTGITGALSIADWRLQRHGSDASKLLHLIWSVRSRDIADLDEVGVLQKRVAHLPNVQVQVHVSSEDGRLDMESALASFLECVHGASKDRAWVYASGPKGMVSGVEGACIKQQRKLRRRTPASLHWHLTHY